MPRMMPSKPASVLFMIAGMIASLASASDEVFPPPIPPEAEAIAAEIRAEEGVASVDVATATVSYSFTTNPRIQNGSVYERIEVPREEFVPGTYPSTIVVPVEADIRAVDAKRPIVIYASKTLHYAGHPAYYLNVESARRFMGVAVKWENGFTVGTYGEWDSHIEGGAEVALILEIPEGLKVQRQANLSGETSIAHEVEKDIRYTRRELYRAKHPSLWWGGPVTPAPGWTALAGEPDPLFRARSYKRPGPPPLLRRPTPDRTD